MYIMYVDGFTGDPSITPGWSNVYDSGNGLRPRAMVQKTTVNSAYNNSNLIVVGENMPDPTQAPGARAIDGFFMVIVFGYHIKSAHLYNRLSQ